MGSTQETSLQPAPGRPARRWWRGLCRGQQKWPRRGAISSAAAPRCTVIGHLGRRNCSPGLESSKGSALDSPPTRLGAKRLTTTRTRGQSVVKDIFQAVSKNAPLASSFPSSKRWASEGARASFSRRSARTSERRRTWEKPNRADHRRDLGRWTVKEARCQLRLTNKRS